MGNQIGAMTKKLRIYGIQMVTREFYVDIEVPSDFPEDVAMFDTPEWDTVYDLRDEQAVTEVYTDEWVTDEDLIKVGKPV